MMKPYDQIIEQVVTDVQREFRSDLLGILLAGSLAYGVPRPQSDVDLFIVIRSSWRQRRAFLVNGVEVELFINPAHQVRAEIRDTDAPATIAMFAHGRILSDPEGVMAQLVQEAQQIWQCSRPAVSTGTYEYFHLRYAPVEQLKDTQDLLDVDEEAARYVLFTALQSALNTYYCAQGRWSVTPKNQLSDLEQHAPDLARLVRQILTDSLSLQERCLALSTFIDQVLEPMGGRLGEWNSPQEVLET
jgi:hypothetical protein